MDKAEYTVTTVAGDETIEAPWRTPFLPRTDDVLKLPSGHDVQDELWEQFKVTSVVHFHNRTEVWVQPFVALDAGKVRDIFRDCIEFFGNTTER
jgi:hypothetical protein